MVKRLPNGNLLVPVRAESDDGTIVGDAWVEIGPDHPEYASWLKDALLLERILNESSAQHEEGK